MEFRDRSILLTGASEGIGRALALELAKGGARLTLVARNEARLKELAEEVEKLGGQARIVVADVTQAEAAPRMVDAAIAAFGALDILILNAGGSMWAAFDTLNDPAAAARDLMELNFFSCVRITHAALPHLKRAKGLVVPVASVAGFTGVPTRTLYSASKHALVGFFESLRVELRGTGVDITVIAPDFVVTELHARAMGADGTAIGHGRLNPRKVMTAEACAKLIAKAMKKRQRLLITSARGRFGRWLKLSAPGLVDRIAARAVARRT